jgi:hypothetical protein
MKILLIDLLENEPNVTVDGRARLRGKQQAENCRAFRVDSYEQALMAMRFATPSVIVKQDASLVVCDSGGSGQIWVCAENNLTTRQLEALEKIQGFYLQLGVSVVFDEPPAAVPLIDVLG